MKLIGSIASPYVRRIRILLHKKDYEFIPVDVFSPKGQAELKKLGPIKRVPILVDGKKKIFDSYLITKYLIDENFDLEVEKILFLINEASDSGITLLQLMRFGLDEKGESKLASIHKGRIGDVLEQLNELDWTWDIPGQWLYCLLDWLDFREIYSWKHLENLQRFHAAHKEREDVRSTDPRG